VLLFLWPTYFRKGKEIGRHYGKRLKDAHNTIKIRHARDIVVGAGADIVGIDQHNVFFRRLMLMAAGAGIALLHAHLRVRAEKVGLHLQF